MDLIKRSPAKQASIEASLEELEKIIKENSTKNIINKNKSFIINEIIQKLQTKYNKNLDSIHINIENLFNLLYCIKILECIQKFTSTIKSSDLKYFPENMRDFLTSPI